MNRRTLIGVVAAGAALPLFNRVASAQTSPKTRNVVFVHGLFADGSCWSKVIARLQRKGVRARGIGGGTASDRGAAGSDGAGWPLFLWNDRNGGGSRPEDHRPRLRRC